MAESRGIVEGQTSREPEGTQAAGPELHLATVDEQGRLTLRGLTPIVGWLARDSVGLTVDEGVLRLSDTRGAFIDAEGVVVALDERCRLQVPYGVRLMTGLLPGVRVVLLVTVDRGLVVVPVSRLLGALEPDGSG